MTRGTKERVGDLETALKDFTRSVGLEFNKLNSIVTRSENLLSFVERRGFLLITLGGTLMECLNAPDFQPREF